MTQRIRGVFPPGRLQAAGSAAGRVVFEDQAQPGAFLFQGDGDGAGLARTVGMVDQVAEDLLRGQFQIAAPGGPELG
jgi:hypothetical protein